MKQETLDKMNDVSRAMLDPHTSRAATMVADAGWKAIHEFTVTHGHGVIKKAHLDVTEARLGKDWREDIVGLFIDDMHRSILKGRG